MLIDTMADFNQKFMPALREQRVIAFDTETSGLDPWNGDRICGMSFAFQNGTTYYLPVRHLRTVPNIRFDKVGRRKVRVEYDEVFRTFRQLPPQIIHHVFKVILDANMHVIGHNLKFDLKMVEAEGIDTSELRVSDTMIMARVANNIERRVALKVLGVRYINPDAADQQDWLKETMKERGWSYKDPETGDTIMHFDWFEPFEMADYAEQDARLTFQLYRKLRADISEQHQDLVYQRECQLLTVLVRMEMYGMKIDLDYVRQSLAEIMPRIADLRETIYSVAGGEFDIDSPLQFAQVMSKLEITTEEKTKKGRVSWSKKAFATLDKDEHPIIAYIEEYRTLCKIKTTYLDNFIRFADGEGVIHADFKQIEAKTGRFSCERPNLQNVPKEDEYGFYLRKCFVPRNKDYVFVLIDWSMMEIRIMADWAGQEDLCDDIRHGKDVHIETAVKIGRNMGVELCGSKSCKNMMHWRSNAKTIFFGLMYGMGVKKLAKSLKLTEEQAVAMKDEYWNLYPNIRAFFRNYQGQAKREGWVRNRYGRRYKYPLVDTPNGRQEYGFAHAAVNHVIQGTGADMAKECMIRVDAVVRELELRAALVAMIHDELISEVHRDDIDQYVKNAVRIMTDFKKMFKLPITVEVTVAENNWADKQPYELAA